MVSCCLTLWFNTLYLTYTGIAPKLRRSKTTIEKSFSDESLPTNKRRPLKKSDSVIVEHPEYSKMAALRRRNSVESAEISSEDIYERIPSADLLDILRYFSDIKIHPVLT